MKRLLKKGRARALMAWAVVAAALPAGHASAQERSAATTFDLVGTVTDQAGVPLVGAFVAPEGSKWGSLTSETGRFVLPNTTAGEVALTAELIGYEKLTWKGWATEGQPVSLALVSKPILLEGLTVVTDQLEHRRRATAVTVRWFDHNALATAPQPDAVDFLTARGGFTRVSCNGVFSTECVLARGRVWEPSVWLDEAPMIGGLDVLRTLEPYELYLVEVYGNGRHIRAYTNRYMERAAERRVAPIALLF